MPIIAGQEDDAIHVIQGVRDLVIGIQTTPYIRDDEQLWLKSLAVSINLDGPIEDTEQSEFPNKSEPVVVLSFTDDESIDHLIKRLQILKDSKLVWDKDENEDD